MEGVEADVDEGADLHVAVLDPVAELRALPVELLRAGEIPELLVEPAQRVGHAPKDEMVVPLPGQLPPGAQDLEGLPIVALADVGEGPVRHGQHLVEAVVDGPRRRFRLAAPGDGTAEITLPVVLQVRAEPASAR